jgi:hypothetical protein
MQTGYHVPKVMGRGQAYPAQGAVVAHLRGPNLAALPAYVCIPEAHSPALAFFQRAGYLGRAQPRQRRRTLVARPGPAH